jgi:hypothetical protein
MLEISKGLQFSTCDLRNEPLASSSPQVLFFSCCYRKEVDHWRWHYTYEVYTIKAVGVVTLRPCGTAFKFGGPMSLVDSGVGGVTNVGNTIVTGHAACASLFFLSVRLLCRFSFF